MPNHHSRRSILQAMGSMAALAMQSVTRAEEYPARALRLIAPVSAGGLIDNVGRLLAEELGKELGQPVIVDNRPGGNTIIGMDHLAKSAPDGYTFGLAASPHTAYQAVGKRLPYDPASLQPISLLARAPGVLMVHPSVPVANVQELVALLRKEPEKYFYAVPTALSNGHISMEMLKSAARLSGPAPVMFKGGAQAVTEVLAGRVQILVMSTGAMAYAKTGQLRAIATTGEKAPSFAPTLPTLKQSGYPGLATYEWVGLMAPPRTPAAVTERVIAALAKVRRKPEFVKAIDALGMELLGSDAAAFSAFMTAQIESLRALHQSARLDVD